MKTFELGNFLTHLRKMLFTYKAYEYRAAMFTGAALEKEAKDKIGHLQGRHGKFAAWRPLAPSTIAEKVELGYAFNHEYNPLLRSGKLRDSIHYSFVPAARILFLGSTSPYMPDQEFGNGSKKIPPRSVIGATMFQATPFVHYTMGKMLGNWLMDIPLTLRAHTYGSI